MRILKICQPKTILQWQLTSDYADLAGGGLWGNEADSLHPTQRFWNLKQLGSTPEGLHFLPVHSNRGNVTAAAMGDQSTQTYAVHLVNNGAKREVTLKGLPKNVEQFKIFVTNKNRNMKEEKPVEVKDGEAHFTLPATSFISLMTETSKN